MTKSDEPPAVAVGDVIRFGNYMRGVVRTVYSTRLANEAVLSAVIEPGNPAAYDFRWADGQWDLIDGPAGGTYIKEGHRDWCHARKLKELSGRS